MVIKFWVRKEKHKKAKRSFKLAKNLLIVASMIFILFVPVTALGNPPDILNLPMGSVIYTMQPYFVMTPDPFVTQYQCQIARTPAFFAIDETMYQVTIPSQPNTIQQYTFTNLIANAGDYYIRCRADDGTGYGGYGTVSSFTIIEGFNNKCQPSSEGVYTGEPEAYYSVYPTPEHETPINRTIFTKKTGLTYAYADPTGNIASIDLNVKYNDTVWYVTDSYDLTNYGTPSFVSTNLNDYFYMSPVDSHNTGHKKYFTEFIVNTPSFPDGECNLTYGYALNINPNLEQDTGDVKGGTIISLTALLIGLLAFLGGRRG